MHRLAKHQVRSFAPKLIKSAPTLKHLRLKPPQPSGPATPCRALDVTHALAQSAANPGGVPPPIPPRNTVFSLFKRLGVLRLSAGGFVLGAVPTWFLLRDSDKYTPLDRIDIGTFDGREGWLEDSDAPSFTYTFKGGKFGVGGERTSVHALMPEEETEAFLKKNENSTTVKRTGNPVIKIDENTLPSKTATEDRHAVDIVRRSDLASLLSPSLPSFWDQWAKSKIPANEKGDGSEDLVMVSVFDGHMGSAATSNLLMHTMHACVAWMFAAGSTYDQEDLYAKHNTSVIPKLIRDAYVAWDKELIQAPLSVLSNSIKLPEVPDFPGFPHSSLLALSDAATRGSAAITAVVDVQGDMVHVANTGDSRAVAGWWNPSTKTWRCDVLSEDHDTENLREADRVRSEHPAAEADDVVFDDGYFKRILGIGQPSRAMANTTFKLPMEETQRLKNVLGGQWIDPAKPILTPPYMTAEPEVTSRKIHPETGEQLKFVVLASDGLWDWNSSEEVALLLAGHHARPHGPDTPKTLLPVIHSFVPPTEERLFPTEDLPGSPGRDVGDWVFEDDNSATHLIRNALGGMGWDRDVRQRVLSMREGGTRVARDDTTAVVMWFGDDE